MVLALIEPDIVAFKNRRHVNGLVVIDFCQCNIVPAYLHVQGVHYHKLPRDDFEHLGQCVRHWGNGFDIY